MGLHPQLLSYDITTSNGVNIGLNPTQTVAPGEVANYTWYAGSIEPDGSGGIRHVPVEFGSVSLSPADPLMQHPFGLIGALVVEPEGASWTTDPNTRTAANVVAEDGTLLFREFVTVVQDDVTRLATEPENSSADVIEVAGDFRNGSLGWFLSDGSAIPADGLRLEPGDEVRFTAAGTARHGLHFADQAAFDAVFEIVEQGSAPFGTFARCGGGFGTEPVTGELIATLRVKQAATLGNLPFLCSQHCAGMPGSFEIETEEPPEAIAPAAGPVMFPDTTPLPPKSRAINYRTEPFDHRFQSPVWDFNQANLAPLGIARATSDTLVLADPATPVFVAAKGMPVRFRMVHPAGLAEQTWVLDGHVWQEEPYVDGSTRIGVNPSSQWLGSRDGFGPNDQFDIVVAAAGGTAGVTGDYLYRSFIGFDFQKGLWGIFRVGEENADVVTITALAENEVGGFTMSGVNSVNPVSQEMAATVSIADHEGNTIEHRPGRPEHRSLDLRLPRRRCLPADGDERAAWPDGGAGPHRRGDTPDGFRTEEREAVAQEKEQAQQELFRFLPH